MQPWTRSVWLCTTLTLLAAGSTQAGCGGTGPPAAPDPGEAPPRSQGEAAAAEPTGLVAEPILYSDASFSYVGFRQAALTDLHSELSTLAGDRVQLRVIPYVGSDESGETVLKGETLYVFVQQQDADLTALKARADRLIATVQEAFPDLGENYSVEVHARLPTGSTVADLDPALGDACGDRNLVRTGVSLAEYQPGSPEERFGLLCDGAKVVAPSFIEEGWDHLPGAWRTTEAAEE